ncbi:MAG TPA: hypothetical protein VMD48_00835 [Solirubrobacteraceae bacterium]|nr:hypothetical protein [Solirubrobacteraceae bacterium]
MGQRSRKRGRRDKPPAARTAARTAVAGAPPPAAARPSRSEQRNAAVRETLTPLEPDERPWALVVGALLAALSGGVQLALWIFGVKLKVAGTHAQAGSTIAFGLLMFVCAIGMWFRKYWAVLGFMAILAITVCFFALALIKASSVLGFAIGFAGVGIGGFLFYKLVRTLSRIQMPEYPGR